MMEVKCEKCGLEYTIPEGEKVEGYVCECGGPLKESPQHDPAPGLIGLIILDAITLIWNPQVTTDQCMLLSIGLLSLPLLIILNIALYKKHPRFLRTVNPLPSIFIGAAWYNIFTGAGNYLMGVIGLTIIFMAVETTYKAIRNQP